MRMGVGEAESLRGCSACIPICRSTHDVPFLDRVDLLGHCFVGVMSSMALAPRIPRAFRERCSGGTPVPVAHDVRVASRTCVDAYSLRSAFGSCARQNRTRGWARPNETTGRHFPCRP